MSRIRRRCRALLGVLVFSLVVGAVAAAERRAEAAEPRALILYDYQPTQSFGKLGHLYAIMLGNLLGHFTSSVQMKPIGNYVAGDIAANDATFYIGSYYDNTLPTAFLADVKQAQKTVVWFKNNLWKIAWDGTPDFTSRYGIEFWGLVGMNAAPTPTVPEPGFYDTVLYKSLSFPKYYRYDPASNGISADPDVGVTNASTALAQVVVPVKNSKTGVEIPYIIRSGNFWYVADIPLTYIGPRDRYLVFSDVLHDILGSAPSSTPRGLVRLEDVSAITTPATLNTLSQYLGDNAVPFSIALVPEYRDPLGFYNGGVSQTIPLTHRDAADLRASLQFGISRGGKIVMHGYTHQYAARPNPYHGVSAEDFEFWDVGTTTSPLDKPIAEDTSNTWATNRIDTGLRQIRAAGFGVPFAFEPPHYKASARIYRIIASKFAKTYQRAFYYTADVPTANDYSAGQFFPYIINKDYYGQKIIPENLGNIEYAIPDIDPTSTVVYTAQDILTNADYAKVVRDGFGSFFFHPFWLEPDLQGVGTPPVAGFTDLQTVINGMKAMGYVFVDASTL